jgi:putative SOS response-associated peptidase YedK
VHRIINKAYIFQMSIDLRPLSIARQMLPVRRSWRLSTGDRKGERRQHRLFSFLTTEANDVVRPIHAKALPVLLTTPDEWDTWLSGTIEKVTALQRPLANIALRIVARGEKTDQNFVLEAPT